jgi:rubrerythrin
MGRDEYLDSLGLWRYPTDEELAEKKISVKKFQEQRIKEAQEAEARRPEMLPDSENDFVAECVEHGRYYKEFSIVSDGVGIIEESDSKCPICGEDCKIISLVPYEINEYRPVSKEEYEGY